MGSIRIKIILILFTAAAIAMTSVVMLTFGLNRAEKLINQAQTSHLQIENFLSLAARLSDFGIAATRHDSDLSSGQFSSTVQQIEAIFESLKQLNETEVASAESDDDKTASASESIQLARMQAQFRGVQRTIVDLKSKENLDPDQLTETIQSHLNAFGLTFAPLLSRSIEIKRQQAASAQQKMANQKWKMVLISVVILVFTCLIVIFLYFSVVRSILKRLLDTIQGTELLSEGKLSTRLEPSGNDELTILMSRFNQMATSLSERENALLEAQGDLQNIIDQRTEDLRDANNQLSRRDKNRRRFFSDVSHELRTPLTVIHGEAEISLRALNKKIDQEWSDPIKKSFSTILTRTQNLRRRVDDLLRIARSESGKLELNYQITDLVEILQDVYHTDRKLVLSKNQNIILETPDEEVEIYADREWIRQMLSGLIANAVKYSPEQSQITVSLSTLNHEAIIAVRDEGSGINEKQIEQVFDRFTKAKVNVDKEDAGSSKDGFGIGLSLAKWIVDEHNGSISITNNETAGCQVTVKLPKFKTDDLSL